MKLGPLVLLEWEDSLGCARGWELFEERADSFVTIQSVGWILKETRTAFTLVPHVGRTGGEPDQGQGIMVIPKRCVLKRTNILVARR